MQCCYLLIYLILSSVFIFGARNFHPRRTRNEKSAREKWSRRMAPVSEVCVMGLKYSVVSAPNTEMAHEMLCCLFIGINLLQVAVHEFGHALGLRHSRVRSAVMYPYYHGYDRDFQLDQDDINGIRFLYGLCRSNSCVRVAHNKSCPLCAYCLA